MSDNSSDQTKINTQEVKEQEETVAPEATETKGESVDDLQNQINELDKQVKENYDLALRSASELENYKKRANNEIIKARKFAIDKLVEALIPCLDSFEQAKNLKNASAEQMQEGIDLTFKLLVDSLAKQNVTRIEPAGEKFNPAFHEAMSTAVNAELEEDTIVEVFQVGYCIEDRVVRPARVIVSKKA